MPNGKTHVVAGMISGGVTALILQKKETEINLSQTALAITIGGASGRLPDIIEPALDPNHRSFFHSFIFGFILMCLGKNLYDYLVHDEYEETSSNKINWSEIIAFIILIGIVAYLIHLMMDAFSRKGLPFIR